MKVLLIHAVTGTSLMCMAIVLGLFVLPEETTWLPGWLVGGRTPPVLTIAVLLLPISVILRLCFRWPVRDLIAALLLAEIFVVLAVWRDGGLDWSAVRIWLFPLSSFLVVPWVGGMLLALGVSALLRGSGMRATQPDAAPNGGPATQLGNSGAREGPPSVS